MLSSAKSKVEGKLKPSNVKFAVGIKTSIRSDRMYQFLYEACAWKFIWNNIFNEPEQRYYTLTTQTFGADPVKLKSVNLAVYDKLDTATKAIDKITTIATPKDASSWLISTLPKPKSAN